MTARACPVFPELAAITVDGREGAGEKLVDGVMS